MKRTIMETYGLHQYPGRLFVVEGVDGSGKSTQIALLRQWLISEGYTVFFSEWNSSPLVKKTTSKGKKKQLLTPTSFSLIHATDFADRTEHDIIPPLKAGAIVLADRYIYTAFARDVARNVDRKWVRELYQLAVKPTVAFYYRVPLEVSLNRILTGRIELKYYESGMDLGLSNDPHESFRLFQSSSGACAKSFAPTCRARAINTRPRSGQHGLGWHGRCGQPKQRIRSSCVDRDTGNELESQWSRRPPQKRHREESHDKARFLRYRRHSPERD